MLNLFFCQRSPPTPHHHSRAMSHSHRGREEKPRVTGEPLESAGGGGCPGCIRAEQVALTLEASSRNLYMKEVPQLDGPQTSQLSNKPFGG